MDPIFQTLLFSNTKGDNNSTINGDAILPSAPRPSRYAQLVPREALRLGTAHSNGKKKERQKSRHGGHSDQIMQSDGNHGEDVNIDVYRMDESGQLELLVPENYNVVYLDNQEDVNSDQEDSTKQQGEDGTAMDVDDENDATKNDDESSDILYIVHKDVQLSSQQSPAHPNDYKDDSSTSDSSTSSLSPTQSFFNDNIVLDRKISAETSMAQTLTRALVQRTEGYGSIRRNFGLDEEEMEEKLKQRRKNKNKLGGSNSSPPAAASASNAKDERETSKNNNSSEDTSDEEDEPSKVGTTKKWLSNLLSTTPHINITDGDDPETLMKLSQMRRWQEDHIDPEMVGINLENWEDQIDWEGGVSSDDEEAEKSSKIAQPAAPYNPETADCTPDFRPAEPEGGHPKRRKRTTATMSHPHPLHSDDPIQILYEPRNPRLDALDLCTAVDWEGACSDSDDEYERPNIPLILQSSVAGKSIASLLAPLASSRPLPFEAHPNYQQRYDNEFSAELTAAELQSNIPGGSEALERYKEMRQKKREQMAKDKQNRVTEIMSALNLTGTGRRITSSLMGPGGAERTGRPSRHAMGSSSTHDAEYVEQLEFVYNHTIARPELSLSEYRQFHRPRLPLSVVTPACPWQFQTRVVPQNKNSKGIAIAEDGSTMIGSYHSMMAGSKAQAKIKNEADLSPSTGDLVIMEYSEERPPLFMTKGMTCRIVNYYRGDRSKCPISAGGGDRPLRKRHGDKAAAAKGATPSGPSGRMERPPRLVGPNQYTLKSAADLIGIMSSAKRKKNKEAAALEAKKAKEKAIDILPEGVTEILHPKVHGPFIGEVEEGSTITGLISNLFAASMFKHESEPTDFLMVLGQASTKEGVSGFSELGVALRPFPPNIYCVGQTEPRVKVFSPGTNEEKKFVNAFIEYHCAKGIEMAMESGFEGLSFESIRESVFGLTKIPATQLRIRLKSVANFDRSYEDENHARGPGGIWRLKRIGQEGFPGVDALGRKVSPEGIAAYESELAAVQRLKDLGLHDLYTGTNNLANIAMVMLFLNGAAQAALERKIRMKKVLDIKRRQRSPLLPFFEKAFEKLDHEHKDVKKKQEIAKFIYQEIQLAPWNISGEFIDAHKRAQGTAMMKLTGIGDPSGVGEAFSLLREDERKPNKALLSQSDGALNAQIKKITGTENDLRKLTMKQMASLLKSYGMKDKQISVLKRWDRVHVIRDLSTKAASDGMGDEMERFARGEKLRLSDQRENYKKRVQEIWRRQITALSSSDAINDMSSRSDMDMGANEKEADAESDAGKGKPDESDGDDDEEDEFAAMMEMEMTSTGDANRLISSQLGDSSALRRGIDAELSKEARELAALQRQREEERAMQIGLEQKIKGDPAASKMKKNHKVIRRKITRTNPDGSQTITFEFIVEKAKVDEIVIKLRSSQKDGKRGKDTQDEEEEEEEEEEEGTCVGHAFWEDEDNNAKAKKVKKLGIKLKRETSTAKRRGPKKAADNKTSRIMKHTFDEVKEERKKKRLKIQEEKEIYKASHRAKGTSNRKERGAARDRMPHVILADRLEQVRALVESRPNSAAFHKEVPRDSYPHYYEIIHDPIDLSKIRAKNANYDYKKASSFLRDFDLMRKNAVNFNGKESPLAIEATEIYEFVKATIEQNKEEFDQMEEAVEDQINNGRRKKSKSTKAMRKSNEDSTAPAMNTANIVVDGVETQVNLGTNLSFGFGGDSDSDDD